MCVSISSPNAEGPPLAIAAAACGKVSRERNWLPAAGDAAHCSFSATSFDEGKGIASIDSDHPDPGRKPGMAKRSPAFPARADSSSSRGATL